MKFAFGKDWIEKQAESELGAAVPAQARQESSIVNPKSLNTSPIGVPASLAPGPPARYGSETRVALSPPHHHQMEPSRSRELSG